MKKDKKKKVGSWQLAKNMKLPTAFCQLPTHCQVHKTLKANSKDHRSDIYKSYHEKLADIHNAENVGGQTSLQRG